MKKSKTKAPAVAGQYIKADGTESQMRPQNGKYFEYEELKKLVGYPVEIVPMPSGKLLVCNEEGKLTGLPENAKATAIWKSEYPIAQYPNNNDELVVGDVLIVPEELIR